MARAATSLTVAATTPMQGQDPHAKRVCGAKTRSGGACRNAVMAHNRCRMHGGATPSGLAAPQTKHGRYSKELPVRLLAKFNEAQADADLLHLTAELGVIDARLGEVISRVDTGESGKAWKEAIGLLDGYFANRALGIDNDADLKELRRILKAGLGDYAAWEEIFALMDTRRRFVESERRRHVENQEMMSQKQVYLLMGVLGNALRTSLYAHVPDQRAIRSVLGDMTREMKAMTGFEMATA